MSELRICVDARVVSGSLGGVEQTIIGLAHGFSQLEDGDEVYHFLAHRNADSWITPFLKGRCRPLYTGHIVAVQTPPNWRNELRSLARQGWHTVAPILGSCSVPVPVSDGVIERAGVDVMHFSAPVAFRTEVPNLYQIHDLQHQARPENFTAYERLARDVQYQTFMSQAQLVSASTSRGRQDILTYYSMPANKIIVVPFAPAPTASKLLPQAEIDTIAQRLNLPERFLFYPAQTWRHKNHITLLHALAHLRDEANLVIPLICSGRRNEFFPAIQREIDALDLGDQVRFLGYVAPQELQTIYQSCRAVVFPSRYEGFGIPVLEAFQAGRPLACANIPQLVDIVGDAALLFDPANTDEMAQAIRRIWLDRDLQQSLCQRAIERVAQFDWIRTARTFRAHHRRIAGRALTEEDRCLLAATPIV